MRSAILKFSVVSLIVAIPAAAAGVAWWSSTTTGLAPESMRAELAENIVREWAPEAAKTYRMDAGDWASRMGPTLASTDIANLERAASAVTFPQMGSALVGRSPSSVSDGSFGTRALAPLGTELVYTPLTPCRIVDTRVAGGPISGGGSRNFLAYTATTFLSQGGEATNCNLPADATALTAKLTATRVTTGGHLTAYPSNEARPLTSSLNYQANADTSNETHLKLCRPGCASQFAIHITNENNVDVVVDVTGYFREATAAELDCTVAQQTGNLDLLGGLQTRSVSCPAGYTATGGGCGGPLGIGVSNSQPVLTGGQPSGWSCDLVGSLLSILSYQVNATCCRTPGR